MKTISISAALLVAAPFALAQSPAWGQCGGQGWTGPTTCVSGYVCTYSNDWYSQCIPGTATSTQPTTTRTTSTGSPTSTSTGTVPTGSVGAGIGQNSQTSINAKFRSHGKLYYGSIIDPGTMSASGNTVKANFGAVTPENSMKFDAIEGTRGSYNFGGSDQVVNFAKQNNLIVRGHTFVWDQQTPSWVGSLSASDMTTVLKNHINAVMSRYKGQIYAYDVVNEHINEDGSVKSTLWTRKLGNDVFRIAFETARAADPNAKLYINDYNLDSNNAKVAGIVRLVNQLNGNGTRLVDGIGSQGHISGGQGSSAQSALTALAAANVGEVAVTELDIASAPSNDYVAVAKACLAVSKCVGITVWGVRDQDSWRTGTNPLLFDNSFKPKAAYNATLAAL